MLTKFSAAILLHQRRIIQLEWEQAARAIDGCLELVDSDHHADVDDFLAMVRPADCALIAVALFL